MTRHGTYSGYKESGCRKECCQQARREYDAHRARQIAYGRWEPWGDLAKVTEHITYLVDAGWTHNGIATASGVSEEVIRRIRHGRKKNVTKDTEAKILAVRPRDRAGYVPAAGTVRRLRALAVQGHGLLVVSRASQVSAECLSKIRKGDRQRVQARVARRIAVAYERLRERPPSTDNASLVSRKACEAGWLGHGAWGRHTIDDPDARPRQTAAA